MMIKCKVCTGSFSGKRIDIVRHLWCDYFAFKQSAIIGDWHVRHSSRHSLQIDVDGLQNGLYTIYCEILSSPMYDRHHIESIGKFGHKAIWQYDSLADTFHTLTALLVNEARQ